MSSVQKWYLSNLDIMSAKTVLSSTFFSIDPHFSNNVKMLYFWSRFKPAHSRSTTSSEKGNERDEKKSRRRCPRAPEEGLHNSRVARQEQMETLCTTRAFPSLKLYQLLFLLCKNGCCAKSLEVTFATASVVGELDKFREKTSTFLEWKKSFCPASLLSGWLLTVLHETWTNWQLGRPTELWWWLNKREGNHSRQESDLR